MVSYCIRRYLHLGITSKDQILTAPSIIKKATKLQNKDDMNQNFVDWVRVRVKAGDGGDGGLSLLR